MSERGRQVLLGGLVVIAASPVFPFLLCPHRAECLHAMGQVGVSNITQGLDGAEGGRLTRRPG